MLTSVLTKTPPASPKPEFAHPNLSRALPTLTPPSSNSSLSRYGRPSWHEPLAPCGEPQRTPHPNGIFPRGLLTDSLAPLQTSPRPDRAADPSTRANGAHVHEILG